VRESRHPQLGDMIVQTCNPRYHCGNGCKHIGLVHKLYTGNWSSRPENAFIHWATDPPRNYSEEHGISCTNIHNVRSEFEVIRNGVRIK
jgi:hypothetical protein